MQFELATTFRPEPLAAAGHLTSDIAGVVALVAGQKNVSTTLMLNSSRCRVSVARARQLAMYLSHVVLGETLTAIGIAFGRDRTTVSYACGLIEDMRDDPAFDAEVSALELILQGEEA